MAVGSTVRPRLDTALTKLIPPPGITISIPGVTVYILSGVRVTVHKGSDSSVLQVITASSGFQTSANSQFYWGVRITGPGNQAGTDVDCGIFWFNATNEHMLSGAINELTGYAAGTYVLELVFKFANASTVQALDANDVVQLCVIESEQ